MATWLYFFSKILVGSKVEDVNQQLALFVKNVYQYTSILLLVS